MSLHTGPEKLTLDAAEIGDTPDLPDDLENPVLENTATQKVDVASQAEGEKLASQNLSDNDEEDEDEEDENEADHSASHSESASPAESSDEEDEEIEENVKDTVAVEINLLAPTVVDVTTVNVPEVTKPAEEVKETVVAKDNEAVRPRGKVAPAEVVVAAEADAKVEAEIKVEAAQVKPATPRGKVAPKIQALIEELAAKTAETPKSVDASVESHGSVKTMVTQYNAAIKSSKELRNPVEQPTAVVTASMTADADKAATRLSK